MTKKVQAMIGLATGAIVLLGYLAGGLDYYQPRASAEEQHIEMASWNELDSIKHQVEVLELKIKRIIDIATLQRRPLNDSEKQEIASLREEIRLHNNRRNAILKSK